MSDKPSYLGLLNALALGESAAHCYLTAWIEVTDHPGVKATLETVAAREGEHGMAFAKRLNELGYSVRARDDERAEKAMAIASSTELSDLEKMRKLGLGQPAPEESFFDGIFKDHSIDIQTGALLGRYIAEEHDSGRRLRACYQALEAERSAPASDDRIDALACQVDALCSAVEDLRELVSATVKPSRNGKDAVRARRN